MPTYRPDIPPHVANVIRTLPPALKQSVKRAIRALSQHPDLGTPLERELAGLSKFRVRRFRIVYAIDRRTRTLRVLAVGHRREIYEAVEEAVRRGRA